MAGLLVVVELLDAVDEQAHQGDDVECIGHDVEPLDGTK